MAVALAGTTLGVSLALTLVAGPGPWPAMAGAGVLAVLVAATAVLWRREETRCSRAEQSLTRALANHEADLHAAMQTERALTEQFPDPLIVLGVDRSILRANLAARNTFEPAFGTVLRHPRLRDAIDRAWAGSRSESVDLTLPVPVPQQVFATVIPLDMPLQDGGRLIVLLSDRSREKAAERVRADFVANASHELRTPLSSIIGFIETLRGPAADDPPAQTRFLGIMAEQAQRMNRLIDDLLSLSRIEMTEHQLPTDSVDLSELVRRIAALFEPNLVRREMKLVLDLPPVSPAVIGNEDQLAQVVQNLLDNAVKYGRDAGTLRIALGPPASTKAWPARAGVTLAISDDGQGIGREHIPRLTERFYRANKLRSRDVGGTGLGLAIVKHIVSRHRGQLIIESTEGAGTTVTVWLPLAGPESGAADTA